jgi:competence protein ComEC
MTPSKIFLYFCLSFIIGIFLSSVIFALQPLMVGFLVLGMVLIIGILAPCSPKASRGLTKKKIITFFFCFLFLMLGAWRFQQAELKFLNSQLRKFNDREQKITLIGKIVQEPEVREKSQKLIIKTEEIQFKDLSQKIEEKVLVITRRYLEYQYGDKLKITGKLETPKIFEDFNYQNYLKKDYIFSLIYFPKIELLEREKPKNFTEKFFTKILKFKNKLREVISQNLSPPQSSILSAMILGDKRKISQEWKEKLNIAGVRHITAVSGLHITVLTLILMTLFLSLGFWRQQAFYFSLIFIFLFILLTGFQPSAIRAGIMGGLVLFAQYLGRLSKSSQALFFAGALMLFLNPFLKYDIGFQLSFLAMLGIIYLLPFFQEYLKFISWENLRDILAMTFSAYLFTLPILIYNFGYFSLVAPLSNLLIVPLLYWIMLFGFLFVLAGTLWSFLGWLLSFPLWLLLTYLIKIVDWFSQIPLASFSFKISWFWLFFLYLILIIFTCYLNKKYRLPKFLR